MSTTTKLTSAKKAKLTTGGAIDAMWDLREKKRSLESAVKDIEGQIAQIEADLLENMRANGIEKATGKNASISISSTVSANVEDWDTFLAWIYKTKNGHLLQRRVSDPAWREMTEIKGVVPGTQPFTKVRLNLRAVS